MSASRRVVEVSAWSPLAAVVVVLQARQVDSVEAFSFLAAVHLAAPAAEEGDRQHVAYHLDQCSAQASGAYLASDPFVAG